MAGRGTAFQHDAALLNPHFASYKIIADDGEGDEDGQPLGVRQESFALPGGGVMAVLDSTAAGRSSNKTGSEVMLGYKEVQDRSRATLLVAGTRAGQAAYIDEKGFVIVVTLDEDSGRPAYAPVHRIESDDGGSTELRGLVALSKDQWLVSDGAGTLTMLETTQQSNGRWSGSVVGRWRCGDEGDLQPVRIVAANATSAHVNVLLQRTCKQDVAVASQPGLGGARTAAQTRHTARTTFELITARLTTAGGEEQAEEEVNAVQVGARYTLEEPPLLAFFGSDDEVVVFAERRVEPRPNQGPSSSLTTAPAATGTDAAVLSTVTAPLPSRTPPYAWTQTSETVTVVLRLPSDTSSKDIRCRFKPTSLHLDVATRASIRDAGDQDGDAAKQGSLLAVQQGRYAERKLHADIDAENSVWTWEANASSGILTLHLEKKHPGPRWVSVFAFGGDGGDDDEDDDDVPETMDAGAMLDMLDGVAKYTTEAMDGDVGARAGVGVGLLEDGLEEEDGNVGHACVASRLQGGAVDVVQSGVGTLTLLAVPLSSSGEGTHNVVLRRDLDGLLYRIQSDRDAFSTKHIDTLPALSYVLASKRDASRVFVYAGIADRATAALAFEPAPGGGLDSSASAAGNLFVYYSPLQEQHDGATPRIASHARSRVVRLGSDGQSGGMVGAAAVRTASGGEPVLLVLCQRRLLVLRNVL